jgi:azurin
MSSSRRISFTTLILAMAMSLLVACGGSEDSSSSSPAPAAEAPRTAAEPAPEPEPETADDAAQAMNEADDMASDMDSAMDSESSDMAMAPAADPAAADAPAENPVTVGDDGVARLTIGSTDTMQYTVRAFTVEAGQQVELTLVHEGSLPVDVMGHNVAILPTDGDYVAFAREVMSGGGSVDNDYLPEGMRDGLVAYTQLIGGGESDTITFTAPDTPGEYPFLCTFPGHFGVMNGIMTVL